MAQEQSLPQFTVVIPAFARDARLRECLAALAGLDYPQGRFTVLVVDDGSPEPLEPVVRPYAARFGWRYVRQNNRGPAAARNTGAKLATTDWLAFVDDDCRPEANWLHGFAEAIAADRGAMLLGGNVRNALDANLYAASSQFLVDYLYSYFARTPDTPAFYTSNNLAVRTDAFLESGGFDEAFPLAAGEDREFGDRWRRGGRRLGFAPGAHVAHHHNLNLRSFCRQHFHYGQGAWQFRQARVRNAGEPVRIERWAFYRDLLLYPARQTPGLRGWMCSALIFVAQVANAAGFFTEWLARR